MLMKDKVQDTSYSTNRDFFEWLDAAEMEEFLESNDGSVCLVKFSKTYSVYHFFFGSTCPLSILFLKPMNR